MTDSQQPTTSVLSCCHELVSLVLCSISYHCRWANRPKKQTLVVPHQTDKLTALIITGMPCTRRQKTRRVCVFSYAPFVFYLSEFSTWTFGLLILPKNKFFILILLFATRVNRGVIKARGYASSRIRLRVFLVRLYAVTLETIVLSYAVTSSEYLCLI